MLLIKLCLPNVVYMDESKTQNDIKQKQIKKTMNQSPVVKIQSQATGFLAVLLPAFH